MPVRGPENLVSDRRLLEHCGLRLDILYFIGYELDEELPWHSTISRTRQLYPASVFKRLFEYVFAQCVAAGQTQAVDSAFVKANASLENLCEKQPAPETVVDSIAHYLRWVANARARYGRHTSGPLGRDRAQTRLLSSTTHYGPADSDARILSQTGQCSRP